MIMPGYSSDASNVGYPRRGRFRAAQMMTGLRRPRTRSVAAGALAVVVAAASGPFSSAQEATKTFVMHPEPKPVAAISFVDEQGQTHRLSDYKGKVVVLNIWATWCVPCRTEMPTLDRLQAALGDEGFAVVPLSVDRGGLDLVNKFFAEIHISHLGKYIDTSGQAVRSVGAIGLPTTLIIDRRGNEVGRVVGPAEWDAPEVVTLLGSLLAKPSKPGARTFAQAGAAEQAGSESRDVPSLLTRSVRWLKALIK